VHPSIKPLERRYASRWFPVRDCPTRCHHDGPQSRRKEIASWMRPCMGIQEDHSAATTHTVRHAETQGHSELNTRCVQDTSRSPPRMGRRAALIKNPAIDGDRLLATRSKIHSSKNRPRLTPSAQRLPESRERRLRATPRASEAISTGGCELSLKVHMMICAGK
jgi:hypothetical protein